MGLIDAINETNTKAVHMSERYVKESYTFHRLKIFKEITVSISLVFKLVVIGGFGLIATLLAAMGLALLIGKMIANYPLGFLIVGGLFMVVSIIAYLFRRHFNDMVVKKLSKPFFN
ncbi:hypothetical protein F6U93_09170 [Tamlana haliotis]|uniref:Phage holin family protein n=1 Tax=Pseudotamlana haliotis TaxID=2614804 RepID=A0A6N6MDG8_9FLAO|nr:hypothetical protein [Tamlana haliotis]KAB1067764.1 hypothetical protein F6U93_09170 [Tamlana haliotis]